jgi:hypothetical protein
MPQNYQAGEFNSFVGGLVTEASPLTFPENASIDEVNFVLDRNGSRRRRLGINLEPSTTPAELPGLSPDVTEISTTFSWKNPGGLGGKSLVVFQSGNKIYFIDRSASDSTSWRYQDFTLTDSPVTIPAAYAPIDGRLTVAFGEQEVAVFSYDVVSGDITKEDSVRIQVRDLFGVAATMDEKDLWLTENSSYRPINSTYYTKIGGTKRHLYNLRNQGWMRPRARWNRNLGARVVSTVNDDLTQADPIYDFMQPGNKDFGLLPSMGDTPNPHLYPNTEVEGGFKDIQRFDADGARSAPAKIQAAAKGSFVIDLFNRGQSRYFALNAAYFNYRTAMGDGQPYIPIYLANSSPNLPSDLTQGGIKAVAEFAGRVWYGGFDGPLEDGDELSPNLSSYVTYSQQVKDFSDIGKCYQVADPTDADDPERVATDGGFIRISGCSNIKAMVNIGNKLIVLAESGIWSIGGTSNGQFDATNQEVTKISEYGVISPRSVALVEGTLAYWSETGIYQVLGDEVGNLKVQEISVNISSLFQSIPYEQKELAVALYDSYDKKIRWAYDKDIVDGGFKELIFDLKLSAFYKAEYGGLETAAKPILLGPVEIPPYNLAESVGQVLGGDDGLGGQYNVVAGVDNVVADVPQSNYGTAEAGFLIWDTHAERLSFATVSDNGFKDWAAYDATGVDYQAYLVTGYIGTGDNARFKQVPYIYFHLNRTETGFIDAGGDLEVVGESSCIVQSQWDWTNSAASNKWGRPFQAYRYKRPYMPTGESDTYDNGQETIVTKNKLRGRGRVLSLKISSEPGKDLQLLGWSMIIGANGNV